MLKVIKFGGSSMADAGQYEKVKKIVEADTSRRVVVVSAAGKRFSDDHKITDLLYLCDAHKKYGVSYDSIFDIICERYISIRNECNLKTDIESELSAIRKRMDEGISCDELVSRGEYLSAVLMADYLGYDFVDATRWLFFKYDGSVDTEKSYAELQKYASERPVVIPGFYGVMPNGSVKTFSRGGSDITGALAAAALDADVYENWTDVSGILMADPRIVEDPQPIERITYDELRELSYMGAQVLHEGTVFPVKEKNIPLNIRNTNMPDDPGTLIMSEFEDNDRNAANFVTGIAGKKNYTIISVTKAGLSSTVGALRKILEIFENYDINIEYVPSGIDNIAFVVPTKSVTAKLYSVLADIQKIIKPDGIDITDNIAIVAVVGRKMASRPGISGKLFATLGENNINIRMISQGTEEVNIIAGIDNKDFEKTIKVLYNSFVKR